MQRILWRAARRSFHLSDSPKPQLKAGRNGSDRANSSQSLADKYQNSSVGFKGGRITQIQIVNSLRSGDRTNASKLLSNIIHMNNNNNNNNKALNAEDFSYILEYCAEAPDPLFVMETWKAMEEREIDLNKGNCRSIIRALSKGGYTKEVIFLIFALLFFSFSEIHILLIIIIILVSFYIQALDWLSLLEENDCKNNTLSIFNVFLNISSQTKNLKDVDSCLEKMESQFLGKSEITYWELLKVAVSQKNLATIHEIWKECTKYYSPSIITLRKFIWGFSKLGDLDSANKILQYMVKIRTDKKTGTEIRVSFKNRYQSLRFDIPVPTLVDLPYFKLNFDKKKYENKQELSGNVSEKLLSDYKLNSNKKKYEVKEESSANISERIFSDFKLNFNKKKYEDKEDLSGNISEKYFLDYFEGNNNVLDSEKESELNEVLLRWSFNDLIHSSARFGNFELAEKLFLQMNDIGLKPSRYTYDGLIKAIVAKKGVKNAINLIESMEKKNIKPYDNTLANISIAYSKNLELDLAESFLDKISNKFPKLIHPFNALLSSCNTMNEPDRAIGVLAKMKKLNVKLNMRTYELMFALFGYVNVPYEEGNILSHVDVSRRIQLIETDMSRNGIRHSFTSLKNLIRALGAEGMTEEMLKYLNLAENMLWNLDSFQKSELYNIVLNSLVKADQIQDAMRIFKNMRLYGLPANVAIYNIMIECCRKFDSFTSAFSLLSLMYKDGFLPQTFTFTALLKVLLTNEDFGGALSLLGMSRIEGIKADIELYNTILREAYIKGRIHVIEHVLEQLHRDRIQPDPTTLWFAFSAYVDAELHSTAMEALQVLSMRMISLQSSALQQNRDIFEEFIYNEDCDNAERKVIESFGEWEYVGTALINLRWCVIFGMDLCWNHDESVWAKRLCENYESRRVKLT
ncbi:hypothetical protein LUZ60_003243 [Juncus effusus]|nr:hypothetical protein LUZ60_003243 [Juncus effusus]